jgi:hypothetical protein
LGIGTPKPIAYVEQKSVVGLNTSFYVSEHLEYDYSIRDFGKIEDTSLRDSLIKSYAQFIYDLHQKRVYFLDNSPGNTLIKLGENGPSFYLVDLNRMKFKSLSKAEILLNLNRLPPHKWFYEPLARVYAGLAGYDPEKFYAELWQAVQDFQKNWKLKRKRKKKLKSLFR